MASEGGGIALVEFKPVERHSLRGFATVRLRATGLTVHGVPVHSSHGKAWAALPSKPMLAPDGTTLRDAAGRVRYAPILEWGSRDVADAFSRAVVRAVEERHPGAVLGAGANRPLAIA